ncbi:MAG: hypothetical protein Q7S80_02005 [bacterium]|nr:hypothetical protein [bacterium]
MKLFLFENKTAIALDHINDDFGADTIFPASMLAGGDSAPDRIPLWETNI